jgi:conjugal transfer pilus assembly protein TraL
LENKKIPRYIDSTPQLFFWEIDEFMILAASLGFGILIGGLYTFAGMGAGVVIVNLFKKYKSGGLPGQLNHLFHWHNIIHLNERFKRGGVRRLFK